MLKLSQKNIMKLNLFLNKDQKQKQQSISQELLKEQPRATEKKRITKLLRKCRGIAEPLDALKSQYSELEKELKAFLRKELPEQQEVKLLPGS